MNLRLVVPALALMLASSTPALRAGPTTSPSATLAPANEGPIVGHTFQIEGSTLTVTRFDSHWFANSFLSVRVDNPTTQFTTIAWNDLTIVSAEGSQYRLFDAAGGGRPLKMVKEEYRVAPGAHLDLSFLLVGDKVHLKLPAKVYFQDHLLGELTK